MILVDVWVWVVAGFGALFVGLAVWSWLDVGRRDDAANGRLEEQEDQR